MQFIKGTPQHVIDRCAAISARFAAERREQDQPETPEYDEIDREYYTEGVGD